MTERREFVRDRDDEAVDVLHAFGGGHELIEVGRRDMDRNADRVDASSREFARETLRRPGLGDRIAEDEMKARVTAKGREHGRR